MPEFHAKISPSSFSRVRKCPASLRFAAQFPNESGAAAIEGTACHEAVERLLDGEVIEPGFAASNGFELTAEHMVYVQEVVDWIVDQEFDRLFTEVRVPVGAALGLRDPSMMWGTSDVIGIKGGHISVVDAKFGFVPVKAASLLPDGSIEHNSQAMCYLAGALHALSDKIPGDIEGMRNVILQPRTGNRIDDEAEVSFADLAKFKEEARAVVELALSEDAPFVPGEDQCRFCPASGSCRAQITAEFEAIENVAEPAALSDEELATWLDKVDHIIATAKAMQSVALSRLTAGRPLPGWKLVTGSARAKWTDDSEVIATLEARGLDLDLYAPRKPTTQTALKKVLGKDVVEALVTRPAGEPKLARADDPGEALGGEFEVLP